MARLGLAGPAVTMSEAQAYVRIETGEEEAIVAGLIRTASELCEAFIGQVVMARDFVLDVPVTSAWQRLELAPVRSVTTVEAIDSSGAAIPLSSDSYAVDIDSIGDGWVRVSNPADARRIRVSGSAGIADGQNAVPEPIRQGVLRLVAHLFNSRDGGQGEMPAAVTALWRPYRRMRVA